MDWMLMPLKRYADFSGRSRRMEYWMWVLFQILIVFAVGVLIALLGGSAMMSGDPTALLAAGGAAVIVYMLYLLLQLAFLVPSLAVGVRRLHDTNRSGWWILAPLAPYLVMLFAGMMAVSSPDMAQVAGLLVLLCLVAVIVLGLTVFVFMLLEGTRGPNNYGPDPKAPVTGDVFA